MTVRDNVAFGLRMRRVGKQDRGERVARALDLVGLTEFADRLPRQLSGGQQQRVALARAIVVEPRPILMDEPLSSLDHRIRVQLRAQLKQLQRGLDSLASRHPRPHRGARTRRPDRGHGLRPRRRTRQTGGRVRPPHPPLHRRVPGFANVVDVSPGDGGYRPRTAPRVPDAVTAGRSDVVAVALRPDSPSGSARPTTAAHRVSSASSSTSPAVSCTTSNSPAEPVCRR